MKTRHTILKLSVLLVFLTALSASLLSLKPTDPNAIYARPSEKASDLLGVYDKLHLADLGLSRQPFNMAIKGMEKLKAEGQVAKDVVSICDFSQSSNQKRLYVIDLKKGKLLFNTLVAHGRNTGEEFARSFSNEPSSNKSSLGFYTTKQTYQGQHGLSLKLSGMEPGFNDKAEARAIVMHGADYVCERFISSAGRLGRSFGCPSVPVELHEDIIKEIQGGTCMFIYYPDQAYLQSSKLLK